MIVMTIKKQGGEVREQHFQSQEDARDSLLSQAKGLVERNIGFAFQRAVGVNLPWIYTLGEVPHGEVRVIELHRKSKEELR